MIKNILRSALILSFPVLTWNAHADITPEHEALIQQCKELSHTVASIATSQQKTFCIERLAAASTQINAAAEWILQETVSEAKSELAKSILNLTYATLNSCNHYIQISHSKLEAKRIKNAL